MKAGVGDKARHTNSRGHGRTGASGRRRAEDTPAQRTTGGDQGQEPKRGPGGKR